MQRVINHFFNILAILLLTVSVSACSGTGGKTEKAAADFEIYEVNHEGRIHVFYNRKLYMEFLELHETPFRLTRIGAGPKGETMVFGLTKADKKMKKEVPAISLYEGKMTSPGNFYGEMRVHDRIYVFNKWEDMKPVREFGHPNFFYTEIASGPQGETVVYVLNKANKKQRPDALIEKFKSMNL